MNIELSKEENKQPLPFSYKSRAGQFEFSVTDQPENKAKEEQVLIRDKATMHDVLLTKSAWLRIAKIKGWVTQ